MNTQDMPNLLWHRQKSVAWFTLKREPNPEQQLPEDPQRQIRIQIVTGIVLTFLMGLCQSLTSTYIMLAFALVWVAVVWACTRSWKTALYFVVLFGSILFSFPQSWILPLLFVVMAYSYIDITNCVVGYFVKQLGESWTPEERRFLYAVYREPKKLSEVRRTQLLARIKGSWREAQIRCFTLARTFSALHAAKVQYRDTKRSILIGFAIAGLITAWVSINYSLSYWAVPWLVSLLGLLALSVAGMFGFQDYKFNHAAEDDRDYAIRSWFSEETEIRNAATTAVFLLTTVLVVRSTNYFPVYLPSRAEIASEFLQFARQPHDEDSARAFLNANPENWIATSVYAVCSAHPKAFSHFLTLLLAAAVCYAAPLFVAQTAMNILIKPVPAAYGHEVAVAKKEQELGILRELEPQDLETDE